LRKSEIFRSIEHRKIHPKTRSNPNGVVEIDPVLPEMTGQFEETALIDLSNERSRR